MQFRFAGGSYNPDRVRLAPYQTVALDVQKLKDSEQLDVRKKVFPKDATHGQVIWIEQTPGSLVGRAEILNVAAGIARSFSCPGSCGCPPEPDGTQCQPPGYTAPVGDIEQFIANNYQSDCNGTVYGPYQTSATWSSSNSTVASVTSGGNVTCNSPGSATLTGMAFQTVWSGQGCTNSSQVPSAAQCTVNVPSLSCTSPVTRGATTTCTVTPQATAVSGWQFKDSAGNIVTRKNTPTSLTWTGTMVTSGTVSATIQGGTLSSNIAVNNRSWHTAAASATSVPNDTFFHLPLPPQSAGTDAGLGEFKEDTGHSGIPNSTIIGDGPNTGYAYWAIASITTVITTVFQYEINPDLQSSTSQFSTHQWGACGYISWSNLLTQTNRHEYNSTTQSHYAFYTPSINSSANNPGDFLEQKVAAPGADLNAFASATSSGLTARESQIITDTSVQPFAVNESETGTFLGMINYAPYHPSP